MCETAQTLVKSSVSAPVDITYTRGTLTFCYMKEAAEPWGCCQLNKWYSITVTPSCIISTLLNNSITKFNIFFFPSDMLHVTYATYLPSASRCYHVTGALEMRKFSGDVHSLLLCVIAWEWLSVSHCLCSSAKAVFCVCIKNNTVKVYNWPSALLVTDPDSRVGSKLILRLHCFSCWRIK